jgi:hypothetical protein
MTMERWARRRQLRAAGKASDVSVEGLHHSKYESSHARDGRGVTLQLSRWISWGGEISSQERAVEIVSVDRHDFNPSEFAVAGINQNVVTVIDYRARNAQRE